MRLPAPRWTSLKKWGQSRLLKSSYVWIVAVPIVARALSQIEQTIVKVDFFGVPLNVDLSLPFTWQVFYFAAIFFSLAEFSYSMRCPRIIRDFTNYTDYKDSGQGERSLAFHLRFAVGDRLEKDSYIKWLMDNFRFDIKRHLGGSKKPEEEEEVVLESEDSHNVNTAELFNYVVLQSNFARSKSRALVSGLFYMGFALIGVVFFQNFLFVVCQTIMICQWAHRMCQFLK